VEYPLSKNFIFPDINRALDYIIFSLILNFAFVQSGRNTFLYPMETLCLVGKTSYNQHLICMHDRTARTHLK